MTVLGEGGAHSPRWHGRRSSSLPTYRTQAQHVHHTWDNVTTTVGGTLISGVGGTVQATSYAPLTSGPPKLRTAARVSRL